MQRLSALLWAFLTCAFLAFTAPTLDLPRGDVAAPSNGIVSRIAATELTVGEESETDKVVFSRYKGCTPLRGPRKQIDKENIIYSGDQCRSYKKPFFAFEIDSDPPNAFWDDTQTPGYYSDNGKRDANRPGDATVNVYPYPSPTPTTPVVQPGFDGQHNAKNGFCAFKVFSSMFCDGDMMAKTAWENRLCYDVLWQHGARSVRMDCATTEAARMNDTGSADGR